MVNKIKFVVGSCCLAAYSVFMLPWICDRIVSGAPFCFFGEGDLKAAFLYLPVLVGGSVLMYAGWNNISLVSFSKSR